MRLLHIVTFSSVLSLGAFAVASTHSAASIRGHATYTAYAGAVSKKGRGDYDACKAHYRTNPEYAALVKEMADLRKQAKALSDQIKARTKSSPCAHQEYTIDIGEAVIAGLRARIEKLKAIAATPAR